MINKLWTDVSLENYNNWYPLTGKITETPQQYIQTWPNVNDWFKTFAIRAQNDINAYLDFILSKFPFDSFKDELIKETLRDMVYVMVEHWVFNRTPIEFNVDATIQFNNGTQFSANSTPTINVWDLAPSRMKIWARLTELKQIFSSYNDDEIDVEKIDLKAFYTRNQVDELIKEQKEFTLLKQIKLYDDLVDDNENEIYRGPISKFVNKGYVATGYDKETETMILDWPDEIGTLPPEALQNNPQIGDFTHAPTCDFSAKQQKNITALTNTKQNKLITGHGINITEDNVISVSSYLITPQDFLNNPQWEEQKSMILTRNTYYQIFWSPNMSSSQGLKGVFFFYGAVPTAHNVAIDSAGYYSNSTNEIKAHLSVQPENDELILSYFDGNSWIVTNLDGNKLGTKIYKPKTSNKIYSIKSNTLDITSPSVINIDKPIKINSKNLETNEIEENNWDIELKDIPPTPSPSGSNWKEVGKVVVDKNNITHIEYIFKDKTHYRIYYSFGDYTSKENNKNYSWQIINFYYQLDTNVLKSSLWISNNNVNADTEINIYNNRIMWGMGRDYIFKKLEELQE
ncbi:MULTISPECIES: hypothetical protein [unclassified Spiroplasma]|uniref:hypothetical protein n=1 Tax=unclassified Spiroplasma TaxID=2637901 RepID=UPI0030CD13A4